MFRRKLLFLLGVMLLLSLAGYAVCGTVRKGNAGDGYAHPGQEELGRVQLVASFYPIYVLTENLVSEAPKTVVANMTKGQGGCLHDYQLTTKDMQLLSDADAFLINGAGMELFLEQAAEHCPELQVIVATQGIDLLKGTGHSHDHEHSEKEQEQEENGHVWMDVRRYRKQAMVLCEGLKQLDSSQAEAYEAAYQAYDKILEGLSLEVQELAMKTEGVPVVLFHEAFAYFADSLGMEVLAELALDEEQVPSAGEIAEVIEEIRYHGTALLLVEEGYLSHAQNIAKETNALVVCIDPLLSGDGSPDSYVSGMRNNLAAVEAALKAQE